MTNPLVSVIIPTYNEQYDIAACVESLQKQTYKPIEIIVVDDGSTDRPEKILKSMRGIHFVRQDHRGPGAARNKGAKRAKGPILVFVDADMTFDARFIDRLTKPIREESAIGTFSKEEFVSNDDNKWALFWSLYRGFKEGRMHPADYPDSQKVFRAILKAEFDSVGGFSEDAGYNDDWTVSQKLGKVAAAAEGAVFFHRNPQTLSEAFSQAKWMAKRPYKLGIIGRLVAILRVSLPVSLLVGLLQSIRNRTPSYFLFRLVVDSAQFLGLSQMFVSKSRVK